MNYTWEIIYYQNGQTHKQTINSSLYSLPNEMQLAGIHDYEIISITK